ncbi:MAG: 7-cyano-7-deazaguanine synthase QueC [Thermoflavifilum sp.]|nr:7-cyano-7-deazaguanine synthase QueC [Thermoflavifilum sp.]MCL6513058.1 7-cyano-7-deazaguanine synthase QueC [Alicyclobacillus sp.]
MSDTTAGYRRERAIVILSGGLDSATCMGIAHARGSELYALTFDYGQRHRIEIERAKRIAAHYGVREHRIVRLDFLRELGGSALTDPSLTVPTDGVGPDIPITYVPGRNLLFLAMASSYAEVTNADAIYIGVNAIDYSGYPDCRPAFIEAFEQVIRVGTKAGVEGRAWRIETPLLHWSKARIIEEGMRLGVPYQWTVSCYQGGEVACGVCDSCRLRRQGFREAGYEDPIPYAQ